MQVEGGKSFTNGGQGGNHPYTYEMDGGFGGGGSGDWDYWTGGGGGGGYSGGGGGYYYGNGGGGGSKSNGSALVTIGIDNNDMGKVVIIKNP